MNGYGSSLSLTCDLTGRQRLVPSFFFFSLFPVLLETLHGFKFSGSFPVPVAGVRHDRGRDRPPPFPLSLPLLSQMSSRRGSTCPSPFHSLPREITVEDSCVFLSSPMPPLSGREKCYSIPHPPFFSMLSADGYLMPVEEGPSFFFSFIFLRLFRENKGPPALPFTSGNTYSQEHYKAPSRPLFPPLSFPFFLCAGGGKRQRVRLSQILLFPRSSGRSGAGRRQGSPLFPLLNPLLTAEDMFSGHAARHEFFFFFPRDVLRIRQIKENLLVYTPLSSLKSSRPSRDFR